MRETQKTVTQELADATAAVKALMRTAFTDQTEFVMKTMKLVAAAEAVTASSEQFAAAA